QRVVLAEARAAEPPLPVPALRCTIDTTLQVAYATPRQEGLRMVVYGRDPGGSLFFYAPRRPTQVAVPLEPDAISRALDWSTRLEVKHAPGVYDLRVLFFDRPILAGEAASGRGSPLQALRLRLEVEGGRP
ncbi:MAG: hypothetical protein HY906_25155, partial [Deltaproteobacteria bacterium]|nr:hypothetical protein [Deltaproteobacteria bacterium]